MEEEKGLSSEPIPEGKDRRIDLNDLFPGKGYDLNRLFPEENMRKFLSELRRNRRDIERLIKGLDMEEQ